MLEHRDLSRRDWILASSGFVALLAWELSGLDLAMTRWVGSSTGFPWRDSFIASRLLHDGGRVLAWSLLSLLVIDSVRPLIAGPSRRERRLAIGTVLIGLVVVPLAKRLSATSCPWDLTEFGGLATYVPHWRLDLVDGGPGHCFPSGHAVAAFAFFGVYFFWRMSRPKLAPMALVGVLALGAIFGWAQWVRGAHFVSHTLWSAWLCWVIGALVFRWQPVKAARLWKPGRQPHRRAHRESQAIHDAEPLQRSSGQPAGPDASVNCPRAGRPASNVELRST